MVFPGQYLERAAIVQVGELCLEALYHRGSGRSPVLILPPTPGGGGSMESPVVAELAYALTRAGHPTLRINYRGVGASQGSCEAGPARLEDTGAALSHLLATDPPGPVILLGLLGSAGVCLELAMARPEIATLILVSPQFEKADVDSIDAVWAGHAQAASWPTLWVQGEGGTQQEAALRGRLSALLPRLEERVIPGADGVFREGHRTLGRELADWLQRSAQRATIK